MTKGGGNAPAHGQNKRTMASCLDTLIGDDNGCATRTGRLYLKDIGITENFLSAILNKEDASTSTFMADRRRLATEYVTSAVLKHYNKNIIGRTFVDAARIGRYADTEQLVNGDASYLHGFVIDVCTPVTNTKLLISRIDFYGETTGDVTVTIYNLKDGTVVSTQTIDAVAGQMSSVEVDIEVQCMRERLRLLVVSDQDVYYKSTLYEGCATCRGYQYRNGVIEARQYVIDPADKKIAANLLPGTDTGGLSVIASVQCDIGAWLCDIKGALALPLLYCLGREIYTMALYNFERYGIQNVRKQDVKDRRDELEAHFVTAMNELFETAITPNDGLCFTCNDRVTTGVILP